MLKRYCQRWTLHSADIVKRDEVARDRAGKRDVDFHAISRRKMWRAATFSAAATAAAAVTATAVAAAAAGSRQPLHRPRLLDRLLLVRLGDFLGRYLRRRRSPPPRGFLARRSNIAVSRLCATSGTVLAAVAITAGWSALKIDRGCARVAAAARVRGTASAESWPKPIALPPRRRITTDTGKPE